MRPAPPRRAISRTLAAVCAGLLFWAALCAWLRWMPLDQFPLQAVESRWAVISLATWVIAGGAGSYLIGRLAGRFELVVVLVPLLAAVVAFGLFSEPLLAVFAGLVLPVPALSGGFVAFCARRPDLR